MRLLRHGREDRKRVGLKPETGRAHTGRQVPPSTSKSEKNQPGAAAEDQRLSRPEIVQTTGQGQTESK